MLFEERVEHILNLTAAGTVGSGKAMNWSHGESFLWSHNITQDVARLLHSTSASSEWECGCITRDWRVM
jgi:hypothetical protein